MLDINNTDSIEKQKLLEEQLKEHEEEKTPEQSDITMEKHHSKWKKLIILMKLLKKIT